MGGEVFGGLVAEGDGGVFGGAGEHEAERAADRQAAADDADLGTGDRYAMVTQEFDDAAWRARQRAGHAQDQAAEIRRVQPVGILGRIDELKDGVGVDVGGKRELDDESGDGGVGVEGPDGVLDLFLRRGGG